MSSFTYKVLNFRFFLSFFFLSLIECCYISFQITIMRILFFFTFIIFSQTLYEAEKRKISFPAETKNGDPSLEGLLKPTENHTVVDMKDDNATSQEDVGKAQNEAILKRIPIGAQGSTVLVGEVDFLEQPAIAFIRLAEGVVVPSLIEVNIPVR